MDDILSFVALGKYILIGIGIIGVIVLVVGLSRGEREFIQRGVYLIIAAVIIAICSYFIVRKTEERALEYIPEYYEEQLYAD